ncbi:MAG: enoyl-CoA hydratase-related protein [Candidatus Aminicenantales bacterium]
MGYKNLMTRKADGIGWISINRPDKLNALNVETIEEIQAAFLEFQDDKDIKVVILTGSGEKAFVAGADISELATLDFSRGKEYAFKGQKMTKVIENFRKPVIAAVNGFALGGGTEIALACHIRVASENARMGQPEVKLGLIPGFGGTQRLARLVGKGKAMELILSGKMIDAKEALEMGLVNRVVPLNELAAACEGLAKEIMANAPLALRYAIKAINNGLDNTLNEGLDIEANFFGESCSTDDSKEGTKAFLEKRKANFKGL